jgi:hypothetical protein
VSLTRERIESLAPDQGSLAAALKLVKPGPVLGASADTSPLWGGMPRLRRDVLLVVSPQDVGYKCAYPSRKFPCKRVLAVLWLRVDRPERFETASPPSWVEEWSARRRPGGGRPRANEGAPKETPSHGAAIAGWPVGARPTARCGSGGLYDAGTNSKRCGGLTGSAPRGGGLFRTVCRERGPCALRRG